MKNMNRWLIVLVITGIISTTAQGAAESTPEEAAASEPLNLPVMEGRNPGWYRGDQGANPFKLGQSQLPPKLPKLIGDYVQSRWVDKDVKIESQVLRGHFDWVFSVAISPDNSFIVTASYDGKARIWNKDGTPRLNADRQRIVLPRHAGSVSSVSVSSVAISPDNSFIVTGSLDNTAQIWDAQTGDLRNTLAGHTGSVYSVAISPDNKFIVTGSRDSTARIWNRDGTPRLNADGQQIVLAGHTGEVSSVAISPDNKFIVTGSSDRTARIWNAQTGDLLSILTGHTDSVNSVAISPDNSFIVTGSYDNTARIWNAQTGKLLNTLSGHASWVTSVAISPDSSFIVTGSHDNTARIWSAQTGKLRNTLAGHTFRVNSVAISSDGSFIVTGSHDNTARVWNAKTGELVKALTGPREWNAKTGELLKTLITHTSWVISVAISPDSSFIVTGSEDKTARIWRKRIKRIICNPVYTQITRKMNSNPLGMMVDYIHRGHHQMNLNLLAEINKLAAMEAGPKIDAQKIVRNINSLLASGANPQSIQEDRFGNKKSIIDIASDLLGNKYPNIMALLREKRSSIRGRMQGLEVVEKFQEMMGGRSSDKK